MECRCLKYLHLHIIEQITDKYRISECGAIASGEASSIALVGILQAIPPAGYAYASS
ncbi:hypothetical protein [Nostoc sp. CENA543]|uniref:hypothetical protein n=1 Tax=Nostoc sp. CENA543 TaxID=1869241 RepID=UPI0012FFD394|nr:hypothetical protein [Nostoc sp. CENA543]